MSWVVSTQSELVCLLDLAVREASPSSKHGTGLYSFKNAVHPQDRVKSQSNLGFWLLWHYDRHTPRFLHRSVFCFVIYVLSFSSAASLRQASLCPSRSSRRWTEVRARQRCPESCIWPATRPGELEGTNDLKHSGAVRIIFKGIFGLCCHNIVWKRYSKM